MEALLAPVPPPKESIHYIHYFCGNTEIPSDLKDREILRTTLYSSVANFLRAYVNIANEFEEASYSEKDIERLVKQRDNYIRIRSEIKRASGEELDLKPYEADMRNLLDMYVQAEDSRVLRMQTIQVGDISIEVEQKDIKNIHLSVYPPVGKVRISAPLKHEINTIRVFAISRLGWIKKQQEKILKQERETPREFLNLENHYYKGERYLLNIITKDAAPRVVLQAKTMNVYVRPNTTKAKIKEIIEEWYRAQLKNDISILIEKWEAILEVKVKEFGVKKMKTKWGTCNEKEGRIWINLDLAKKPPRCLDYIVLHEMVHLLEKNHNERFVAYLDKSLPNWRHIKEELNRLPLKHEDWKG